MVSITVKYFYREIETIAEAIERLGLTVDLIVSAKQQNLEKMNQDVEKFKAHHNELWQRIKEFYKDYADENYPIIFCDKGMEYNKHKIKAINLVCFCTISEGAIRPEDLFLNTKLLKEALYEEGYPQIAEYVSRTGICTLKTFMKVLKKE